MKLLSPSLLVRGMYLHLDTQFLNLFLRRHCPGLGSNSLLVFKTVLAETEKDTNYLFTFFIRPKAEQQIIQNKLAERLVPNLAT